MKKLFFTVLLLCFSVVIFAQQSTYQVIKVATKTYSDFATAATTNTIASGYSLPAKWVVRGAYVIATTAFNGGLIGTYTVSVGVSGNLAKYSPPISVYTTTLPSGVGLGGMESLTLATSIVLTATSTGGLLNTATQGSLDVYMVVAKLPD